MALDITPLCGAAAIRHVAAVCGAMFRTAIMRRSTGMGRTTDGIAVFRGHRQVLVAMRGIADMGLSRRVRLTMLGARPVFLAGMLCTMFGTIMGGSGLVYVAVFRVGFGPCVYGNQRKRQGQGKQKRWYFHGSDSNSCYGRIISGNSTDLN